jgi:hypothetical protein
MHFGWTTRGPNDLMCCLNWWRTETTTSPNCKDITRLKIGVKQFKVDSFPCRSSPLSCSWY